MDEKTALTYAITKALAYQENGGSLPATPTAGKTGEMKSIFQFEPGTWEKDAGEILGDSNAPLTPDNETKVVTSEVSNWIDEGYNVKQIASMWNAGRGEPNAYTGTFSDGSPSVGVNTKYGVKFDVPTYANNVANYAKQFYIQDFAPQVSGQSVSQTPESPVATVQPTPSTNSGMLNPSVPSVS
jgi:hypothetical protein